MIKLDEKPYLDIYFDEEHGLIIQNWKGFASPTQYREGIQKSWELFRIKDASLLLVNMKTKEEFAGWLTRSQPMPLRYGLRAQAFILPSCLSEKVTYSINAVQKNAKYFADENQAKTWLFEQTVNEGIGRLAS